MAQDDAARADDATIVDRARRERIMAGGWRKKRDRGGKETVGRAGGAEAVAFPRRRLTFFADPKRGEGDNGYFRGRVRSISRSIGPFHLEVSD